VNVTPDFISFLNQLYTQQATATLLRKDFTHTKQGFTAGQPLAPFES